VSPKGWKCYLNIDGVQVVGGQSYSHGEYGSYNFHGYWYNQKGKKYTRGEYSCDFLGLGLCHLEAHTPLSRKATGNIILGDTYPFLLLVKNWR
jgi:hypothetical protein